MVFRLKKGDLIDIVAPSSFIDEYENFQKGIEILKNWGLEINENNSYQKDLVILQEMIQLDLKNWKKHKIVS